MKLLNDLALQFEKELWALNPELAVMDTILKQHPEIMEIVRKDVTGGKEGKVLGRQDMPTVEQIVRAAIYKEMKNLTYRELEFHQHDSRLCSVFIGLDDRKPFTFKVYQKYISQISAEALNKVMVRINQIAAGEGIEEGLSIRMDSTVVETNIHHPTNNSLVWDCIKTIDRLLKKLKDSGVEIKVRRYKKQAKKTHYKINNSSAKDKRQEEFKKQLKLLRASINQGERALFAPVPKAVTAEATIRELKGVIRSAKKVYDITLRHEVREEPVAVKDKIVSIYEDHTDIIVKGKRDVEFGHKVNLATGRSNLILDCRILDGNTADSTLYTETLDRIKENYGIVPRDAVTDGGYASTANAMAAQERGIINIVFNKITGSLKNIVRSANIATRLKKWRSGMEAVISNLKRGFELFRCEWKTRARFDAEVYWNVIAYNIRVITGALLAKMQAQLSGC
ncbi:MAG TPA: ISNCY family transposase [Dissulfurispiraceae bacterium]|nr:ISNCY family transposase [Dissulfurispiraceae bacterium]